MGPVLPILRMVTSRSQPSAAVAHSGDDVRENRTLLRREVAGLGVVDQRPEQIGGQQIGRELDALESDLDGLRERRDGQSLGESGDAFDQDVIVRQQCQQEPVDHLALAHDDPCDLLSKARQ